MIWRITLRCVGMSVRVVFCWEIVNCWEGAVWLSSPCSTSAQFNSAGTDVRFVSLHRSPLSATLDIPRWFFSDANTLPYVPWQMMRHSRIGG